jgi:NADPH:quinone reductase-like Zn-dependent oxidoreductase
VQIAKAFGAEVTGVCSTPNVDMVASIGADQVIDYTQQDFTQTGPRYDPLVDMADSRTLAERRRVLAPNGILVAVGGPDNGQWIGPVIGLAKILMLSAVVSQTMTPMLARQRADDLAVLRELLENGKVTRSSTVHTRSARFPGPSATSNKDTPGETLSSPSKFSIAAVGRFRG